MLATEPTPAGGCVSSPGAGPALEVADLGGGYLNRRVIQNVAFSVGTGELVGLIGPNGAGKSTLLRLLSGVLAPWTGRVVVLGRDLASYGTRQLARTIAYVPQSEPALFDFTVRQVVMMGRHPYVSRFSGEHPEDYRIVSRSMALADIVHLADRPVTTLSGGEHRRVLIARAIAQQTPLLLLDEPTAHLDLAHQSDILALMADLCRETRATVLAALHDLNLAADHCNRLLLLAHGRLLADGSPESVLQPDTLEDVYGVPVAVTRNPLTGRPLASPLRRQTRESGQGDYRVHVICGGGTGVEVMSELARLGHDVSVGVLNRLDSDHEAAAALRIPCIEEAPFSPISDGALERAYQTARGAQVVVVTSMPLGRGNVRNLELAQRLVQEGLGLVILEETPVANRDFTGGTGARLWHELAAAAFAVTDTSDGVIRALRRLRSGGQSERAAARH